MYDFGKALERQCLARIDEYYKKHPSSDRNELAAEIIRLVRRNKKRLPKLPSDLHTNIPDAYIDDLIKYYVKENQRVVDLKAGDIATWNDLLVLIKRRVYTNIYRYYVRDNDIDTLVAETVQDCSFLIWMKLENFHYDCPLDAWVSCVVANEVRDIRWSAAFKNKQRCISFDQPLHDSLHPSALTLGDVLPDEQAARELLRVDQRLTIEAGFVNLSHEQCELVIRLLAGQTSSDIAIDMDRSTNAIYKLRQRAIKKLRVFFRDFDT